MAGDERAVVGLGFQVVAVSEEGAAPHGYAALGRADSEGSDMNP
jgi:hypothetical protein